MNDDLISRKALLKRFEELKENPNNRLIDIVFLDGAMSVIDAAPAVDAEPVKHSEWVEDKDRVRHWHCRRCGLVEGMAHYMMRYCPNCGAKMEGKK